MDITSIDNLLTTTRSVRLRLDLERPVERKVIEECLNIAIQAPSGSNAQGWHFMIVTEAEKRAKIAEYYRKAWEGYKTQSADGQKPPSDRKELRQALKVVRSAQYLADNMQNVPVLVIPCIEGRVEDQGVVSQASLYGSILPAAWSFMLAARARGLGASWTTLHLIFEKQVAEILGIPDNITQAALLPVAYYTGEDFRPAKRKPLEQLMHWESWQRS